MKSLILAAVALLVTAAPAHADLDRVSVAYAAAYGEIVCDVLDEHPSVAGVLGIGQAIVEDGLTANQAGQVIQISVTEICPRHAALLQRFINRYGSGQVA